MVGTQWGFLILFLLPNFYSPCPHPMPPSSFALASSKYDSFAHFPGERTCTFLLSTFFLDFRWTPPKKLKTHTKHLGIKERIHWCKGQCLLDVCLPRCEKTLPWCVLCDEVWLLCLILEQGKCTPSQREFSRQLPSPGHSSPKWGSGAERACDQNQPQTRSCRCPGPAVSVCPFGLALGLLPADWDKIILRDSLHDLRW